MKQARLSYKYWHSSASLRGNMVKPFFDKNQCKQLLTEFPDNDSEKDIA